MSSTSDVLFKKAAAEIGIDFSAEVGAMHRYELAVGHDRDIHVSGHLPRLRGAVAVGGRVGGGVTLEEARRAARLATIRALAALRQHLGSLARVGQVLRLTVYVQGAEGFVQHAQVADAASDVLHAVLQEAAGHARTVIGVHQLPENAAVQVDLVVAPGEPETSYSTF
jgi:enamine deaminase RidA (YjgF/YER057c/UK114 family)